MANPFRTIDQLLLAILVAELDRRGEGPQLDKILAGIAGINNTLGTILADQEAIKADIRSIKNFIGAPDSSISEEDQAALDKAAKQLLDLEHQAESINTQPPQ